MKPLNYANQPAQRSYLADNPNDQIRGCFAQFFAPGSWLCNGIRHHHEAGLHRFGGDKHRTDDSSHREYAGYRLFALLYPLCPCRRELLARRLSVQEQSRTVFLPSGRMFHLSVFYSPHRLSLPHPRLSPSQTGAMPRVFPIFAEWIW